MVSIWLLDLLHRLDADSILEAYLLRVCVEALPNLRFSVLLPRLDDWILTRMALVYGAVNDIIESGEISYRSGKRPPRRSAVLSDSETN